MSERMLRFTDINWADVIASTDEPLRLCLRQNIAMYFKVRNSQLVYRHHTVSRGQSASADSIPAAKDGEQVAPAPALESSTSEQLVADATSGSSYPMGFDEELVYLRVQNKPLADLTSSPTSDVSSFDSGGFSMPRPSRLTGERDRRGWEIKTYDDITHPALMKVDFYHAFLVNKKRWELLKPNLAVAASTALEKCTESVEIALSDLYLTSSDVDALKKDLRNASEMVEYPFKHQESIPGIYRMFQAAYAHNRLNRLPKENVAKWLLDNSPKDTFKYRSMRTAKKFVWLELDRSKGGDSRGEFNLEDMCEWATRRDYEFPFVSKGLSLILAIADWWEELKPSPDETRLPLIRKLEANKFSGLEIGDLVYLICNKKLTDSEVNSYYALQEQAKKKCRPIVDRKK